MLATFLSWLIAINVLNKLFFFQLLIFNVEKIPKEILKQGPKGLLAYRQASRHGTKSVHRTRIMLVGQERVGKTSLMNSLLGRKYGLLFIFFLYLSIINRKNKIINWNY